MSHSPEIIGIGASTGDLFAFEAILNSLPARFKPSLVFIYYDVPDQQNSLSDLLISKFPAFTIQEVTCETYPQSGYIYVNAPNCGLIIENDQLKTYPLLSENIHHSIDRFFISLAHEHKEHSTAVILSGSGSDGTRGAYQVFSAGGTVIVQNPRSAKYPEMPQSVISSGKYDKVLDIDSIVSALPGIGQPANSGLEQIEGLTEQPQFDAFFYLMHEKTGHWFNHYKRNVIIRRLQRRLFMHGISRIDDYLILLNSKPEEAFALAQDFMIGVTSFFRDREMWNTLKSEVITQLISPPKTGPVRVWSPACSTGEEAYSIAMLIHAELDKRQISREIQVFATDINENALEKAREGKYPENMAADIPPDYLKAFFTCSEDSLSIIPVKGIREHVVFARQNVLSDPPFSKLDLVICRNLLIYLEPEAQEKCFDIFHYALKSGGYLFLGNAETLGSRSSLFRQIAGKHSRIFQKIGENKQIHMPLSIGFQSESALRDLSRVKLLSHRSSAVERAQEALLERYAPAAVGIDSQFEIFYRNGPTNRFLVHPRGAETSNLLDHLPENVRGRMRAAVLKALQENTHVSLRISISSQDRKTPVSITVSRLDNISELALVTFRDGRRGDNAEDQLEQVQIEESALRQLEHELSATREDNQRNVEQLKSLNEELQSANEELQAANEELETSREELQSLNEELSTVNNQLQSKIEEQDQTNNDLNNFISSTNIPTLFLDQDYRVRRFTPAMTKLVKLIPSDLGRYLLDLSHENLGPDLIADVKSVLEQLIPSKKEFPIKDTFYIRTTLPYRTLDNRIEGVVVNFIDITERKKIEEEMFNISKFPLENPSPVLRIDQNGIIQLLNGSGQQLLKTCNCAIGNRVPERWSQEAAQAFKEQKSRKITVPIDNRHFQLNIVPVPESGYLNVYAADVTERVSAEKELEREKDLLQTVIDSPQNFHIAYLDKNFNFVRVNRIYAERCGFTSTELIGKNHFTLFPDEENEKIFKKVRDTGIAEEYVDKPFTFPGTQETTYWNWVLTPLKNKLDSVEGLVLALSETTERKKVEIEREHLINRLAQEKQALAESEQRYRIMGEILPYGIWLTDADGKAVYTSQSFLDLLDMTMEEMQGFGWTHRLVPEDIEPMMEKWLKCVKSGRDWDYEHRIIDRHGEIRTVLTRGRPVRDENGKITAWAGINLDITERKSMESSLALSELQLKRAQEIAHLGSWELDLIANKLTWSDEVYRIFGLNSEEFVPSYESFLSAIHPDDCAMVDKAYSDSIREGKDYYEIEHRVIRKNTGEVRIVHEKCEHYRDENGNVIRSVGMIHDITERKIAEQKIRESEEKYHTLFENMAEEVHYWKLVRDTSGQIKTWKLVDANPPTLKTWGFDNLNDIIGKTTEEIFGPGATDHYMPIVSKIFTENKPLFYEDYFPHLNKHFRFASVPLGEYFITTGADISHIKQAQKEIEEREKRLRLATDAAELGVFEWDVVNDKPHWDNERMFQIFGLTPGDEPVTREIFESEVIHPEDLQWFAQEIALSMQSKAQFNGKYRIKRRNDGQWRWIEYFGRFEYSSEGQPIRLVSVLDDITEQKEAREALVASEKRLSTILEQLPIGVWITDPSGRIVNTNPQAEKIWAGQTPLSENITEYNKYECWWPDNGRKVLPEEHPIPRALNSKKIIMGVEYNIRKFDGSEGVISASAAPIIDYSGNLLGAVGLAQDISERKKADEILKKSEKRFALLAETANKLLHSTDPQKLVNSLCQKTMEYLDCDVFFNYLVNDEKQKLHLNACSGIPEETAREIEWLNYGIAICGCAALQAIRIVADDIQNTSDPRAELVKSFGVKAYACHPLFGENGKVLGTLSFGTKKRSSFNEDDLSLMNAVADQVATAMNRVYKEKQLQIAYKRLQTFFDHRIGGIGILIAKFDGIITHANDYFLNLLGYTREELDNGHINWKTITPPGWEAIDEMALQQLEKNGISNTIEKEYSKRDGTRIPVLVTGAMMPESQGDVLAFVLNITDRKLYEQSIQKNEQRLRTMFEAHTAVMLLIDPQTGAIVEGNSAAASFYGYTREELRHLSIEQLNQLPPEQIKKERLHVINKERNHFEFPHKLANGDIRIVEVYSTPIFVTEKPLLFSIIHDITERKKLENEVRRKIDELASANKELEAFSYSVSHDLRAPLRAIKGFSEFLLEDYLEKLDDTGKNYIQRIISGAEKMGSLIDDMLSLSRISQQEMILEKVDLSSIAKAIIEELQSQNPDRNVEITIEESLSVHGDSRLLNMALTNLFSNAWKYTGKTTNPKIEFGCYQEPTGTELMARNTSVFFIKDNGAGFPKAQTDRLFKPFQRLHSEKEFPGTGIGLAIVQRVINRHGGKIWITGEEGKGATVWFEL